MHRLNPEQVSNPRKERQLYREQKRYPIGSRRRRAALASSANIPFQELPYQCFQEARKVLNEDRAEKVAEIEDLKAKIVKLSAKDVPPEREAIKEKRLKSWNEHIDKLKIFADINDPLVKRNFEDGFGRLWPLQYRLGRRSRLTDIPGDMNKPIYRHLSDLKWRSHKREILMQRIKQMNVVPDVLPAVDPTVSTTLSFHRNKVAHGDFVLASSSEKPPVLEIQSYEKGSKLVTIAVVTPDTPNVEKDGFDYRCHFLAVNILIDPTHPIVDLAKLSKKNSIVQAWYPPHSQKGAPYQRLAVFVLEQAASLPADGSAGAGLENTVSQARSARRGAFDAPGMTQDKTPSAGGMATADIPPSKASSEETQAGAASATTTPSEPPPSETATPASDKSSNLSTLPLDPNTPIHERLDIDAIKQDARYTTRENFILRSFATKYRLRPIGVDLFRTQWDVTTANVMRRNGIVGHDVEFKRKRVDPLPYQRLKSERYR